MVKHSIDTLLQNNKNWAAEKVKKDKDFFERLKSVQTPPYLWIGCSDSRVPANEITGTMPGEIFVHRNIANLVVHTDSNLLSVLEYAVVHLGVEHIIVCGHYGCGGVKAAMNRHSYGVINMWIRNIKDIYKFHRGELAQLATEDARFDRLVELNVQEQVMNLAKTTVVQQAWKHHKRPHIHGWVYGLSNGIIKPIVSMAPECHLDPLYEYDDL